MARQRFPVLHPGPVGLLTTGLRKGSRRPSAVMIFLAFVSGAGAIFAADWAAGLVTSLGATGAFALFIFSGRANGPDFWAPCLGCGVIGDTEIFVGTAFADFAAVLFTTGFAVGWLTAFTGAAGLADFAVGLTAFTGVLLPDLAVGLTGFTVVTLLADFADPFVAGFAGTTLLPPAAGLLAAGLFAAALVPGLTGVAAGAAFTVCGCAGFGFAVGLGVDENLSLIFWINELCADAVPTSMIANSN
jgi:hypothetical protein